MSDDTAAQDETAPQGQPAVAPEPGDRPPVRDPDLPPDPKDAGATGWQAIAAPGKPDGEVDTRADRT